MALEAAVGIATHVYPPLATLAATELARGIKRRGSSAKRPTAVLPAATPPAYPFLDPMLKLSLEIPRFIAEAHSLHFDFPQEALTMIERARFCCNRMIVYLEQIRDIYTADIDRARIEEIVKSYAYNRTKIFRLSAAWKKWVGEKK